MSMLSRLVKPVLVTVLACAVAWGVGAFTIYYLLGRLGLWPALVSATVLVGLLAFVIVHRFPWLSTGLAAGGKRAVVLAGVGIFVALEIALFAIPIQVPPVSEVMPPAEILTLSKGEQMALYHFAPPTTPSTTKITTTPILFVNGGPGGPLVPSAAKFLEQLAAQGFEVYTFDHYSSGHSGLLTYDPALLTIADEVRRVHEIMTHIGTPTSYVLGHSYAGALLGRVAARYPEQFAKLVLIDTSPLYDLGSGNLKTAVTKDPELAKLLAAEEGATADGNSPTPYLANLSLRENARGLLQLLISGPDGAPTFGANDEWSFFLEGALHAFGGSTAATTPRQYYGVSVAAQLVNKDIERQPDYAEALIAANTPPVLVVHPEHGIVPWPIHKDYENFFDSVRFLPVPDADHGAWEKPENAILLTRVIPAFLLDQADPAEFYTGRTDPFAP